MYLCLGCGSNLRFDIATQRLKCDSCENSYDVREYDEIKYKEDTSMETPEDKAFYDSVVLSCPHCGGEVITNDENTVASYCSYCGASVVLERRMQGVKKPQKIIPFAVSKEQCRKNYKDFVGKAFFVPKELKNDKYIEQFRGIYMPYWTYEAAHEGELHTKAESKPERHGDYLYYDCYKVDGTVRDKQKGISFDAEATYDDELSKAIEPYDYRKAQEFSPAYMCGFFGDLPNVPEKIYSKEAGEISDSITKQRIEKISEFKDMDFDKGLQDDISKIRKMEKGESTLFPVWFLTYRKNDRVAYAIVNGQTGATYADMPASIKKYIIFSLILAIPIYFILEVAITMLPTTLLKLVELVAIVAVILYFCNVRKVKKRESHEGDKGYATLKADTKTEINKISREEGNNVKKSKLSSLLLKLDIWVVVFVVLIVVVSFAGITNFIGIIMPFAGILTGIVSIISNFKEDENVKRAYISSVGIVILAITMIISGVVDVIKPIQDWINYIAIAILLIGIVSCNMAIIRKYNVLATRPLPQFDRKGGEQKG